MFKKTNQKLIRKVVFGLLIVLGLCFSSPVEVRAEGETQDTTQATTQTTTQAPANSNDLNGVNVTMGKDGSLKVDGLSNGDGTSTWNTIFNKTKVFIIGFSGLAMLVFVGLFVKNFAAVGASATNPTARSQALVGCLWTGIAAAACGSVTLIVGLFWNAFK